MVANGGQLLRGLDPVRPPLPDVPEVLKDGETDPDGAADEETTPCGLHRQPPRHDHDGDDLRQLLGDPGEEQPDVVRVLPGIGRGDADEGVEGAADV